MPEVDVLVVGAGAAGLFAGLAARGVLGRDGAVTTPAPGAPSVAILTNEARLGLKILVSGGGRCNVTNERVTEADYLTSAPGAVRNLLRAFPPASARAFFLGQGVKLYAEPTGKLFPTSDDAHDVLDALLAAARAAGVPIVAPAEVTELAPDGDRWVARTAQGEAWWARRAIVATGGKSLPKTGSRGWGLEALARLGHEVEPPVPALTPLRLANDSPLVGLSGLTVPALLTLAPKDAPLEQVSGAKFRPLSRAAGSLLVTHQGASGPAALDVSGPCGRALLRGDPVALRADFLTLLLDEGWAPFRDLPKAPGSCLPPDLAPRPMTREAFEAWASSALDRERSVVNALPLAKTLTQALCAAADVDPTTIVKRLDARARARLHAALTFADLRLAGTDGYAKAEVTAGGVRLEELDRVTLESKRHAGLSCCGEVVDVTGRLGGFNFQWAWTSGWAAGEGARRALLREDVGGAR